MSMIVSGPSVMIVWSSSNAPTRACQLSSPEMPVSLSSTVTRSWRIGSTISRWNGPMFRSVGSMGASPEAWNECCSSPTEIDSAASQTRKFG
jgi:hypothetical protein